jgi:AsmA-like C-terminal region
MSVAPPRFSLASSRNIWRWLLAVAAVVLLVAILPALLLALWGPSVLGRVLSAHLQTAVSVQRVTGGWWSGVTVHQLTVAEDPTPQAPMLVRVDTLTVNLPLVFLLLSTKPIPVRLDAVHIDLRRRQDGQWNLTSLLKALETSTPTSPDASSIPSRFNREMTVTVTHGTLRVDEETELTNLAIGLQVAGGRLTITQADASVAGGTIALQGEVSLRDLTHAPALQWRLAGIHLDQLLGPAFQFVTIAEATGRLTQQGDGLMLETFVQVPTFALAPGTLGQRQPHLTRMAVTCTLQLQPPFTRLDTEACRLDASEAQLSLRGSVVDLGSAPQLTLRVDGSLAGSLVAALTPEVPGHFPDMVHVVGQITVPFREPVWPAMSWHLAVTSERFVFDEIFTEVHTTLVKSADRLEIADLRAKRGTGRLHGAGAWRLAAPTDGGLQVEMNRITLQQSLAQDAAGRPSAVEGTVSGTVAWHMGHEGERLTVDARVQRLHLRHATAALTEVLEGRLHGRLGRERDGTWWGDALAFQSDDLTVTLPQGHVRLSPAEVAHFEVHTTVRAEGAWLTPLLASAGLGGLVLSGQNEVALQVAGSPKHPFETMKGKGSVQFAAGAFHHQPFSSGHVTYELTPGRLHLPQGVLKFETGTAAVHGSFGVPQPFSGSGDQLSVRLHQVPVGFMQQGAATLSTVTLLNGRVIAQSIGSSQVRLGVDLQVPKTTRQPLQGGEALMRVELPAFHLTSDVLTAPPWVHWQTNAVRIEGDGVTAELRDVEVRHTLTHYDLSGAVDLQASTEVITGLVGGVLPDGLLITGPLEISGHTAGHIALDGSVSLRDLAYTGNLRLARVDWDGTLWETMDARLTVEQGRLTIDDASARTLGGWMRLRPKTFIDLQGPRRDFHVHLAAEQLDLRLETGKRLQLLALVIPLFLLEPDRKEPIRMSGSFDAELHASGTYDGQPGWSQSVNGSGYFRIAQGAVIGSTLISGFVAKALTLPANLVDQSFKALLDRGGKPLQVLTGLLQRSYDFGTLNSPIELRAGEIHLADNLTVGAPEFSLVINGYSTLEGTVDYDVHSDLVHRTLFGEVINLAEAIPLVGTVLRHINPFHLIHRHLELSATVQGNVFRRNAAGQPDVHVDVYFIQ